MATLTAWKFNVASDADDALTKLEKLHSEMLINLHDAAVVSWEVGHKKPRTHEMHDTTAAGALHEAFGLEKGCCPGPISTAGEGSGGYGQPISHGLTPEA